MMVPLFALLAANVLPTPALVPIGEWEVKSTTNACMLTRNYGDVAAPITIGLRPWPLSTAFEVEISGPTANHAKSDHGFGRLAFDGIQANRPYFTAWSDPNTGVRTTTFSVSDADAGRWPTVTTLAVSAAKIRDLRFSLVGLAEKLPDLATCQERLTAKWGADPRQKEKIGTHPQPIGGSQASWIDPADIPSFNPTLLASGVTVMLYSIGLDGRVQDCWPVRSSGLEALDQAACRSLTKHAASTPGVANDGSPMVVFQIRRVPWRP